MVGAAYYFWYMEEGPPEVYQVDGTLRQNDSKVEEGGLIFMPETSTAYGLIINAAITSDGKFTVKTEQTTRLGNVYQYDGMPKGNFRIIYHPISDGSRSGLEVELDDRIKIEGEVKDLELVLPAKLPEGAGEPRDDDEDDE